MEQLYQPDFELPSFDEKNDDDFYRPNYVPGSAVKIRRQEFDQRDSLQVSVLDRQVFSESSLKHHEARRRGNRVSPREPPGYYSPPPYSHTPTSAWPIPNTSVRALCLRFPRAVELRSVPTHPPAFFNCLSNLTGDWTTSSRPFFVLFSSAL
eukprot:m.826310 g.826310  ORF g.826310 m.826310 type:complete len:152 (-) comp59417_c0_seq9:1076-1531(-)